MLSPKVHENPHENFVPSPKSTRIDPNCKKRYINEYLKKLRSTLKLSASASGSSLTQILKAIVTKTAFKSIAVTRYTQPPKYVIDVNNANVASTIV